MQIRSIFLSLPLELDFIRSMLDRSKPFTLDKDRFILHRSSLNRSICASVNGVLNGRNFDKSPLISYLSEYFVHGITQHSLRFILMNANTTYVDYN